TVMLGSTRGVSRWRAVFVASACCWSASAFVRKNRWCLTPSASYHETRHLVRPCFLTFAVFAIYRSFRRGGCCFASTRTNGAIGSEMPTSPRSQRATEFQWTPIFAARPDCVRRSRRRMSRSSSPVMGWTIQVGYFAVQGAGGGRRPMLLDVDLQVTGRYPHTLPRQVDPWEVGRKMA